MVELIPEKKAELADIIARNVSVVMLVDVVRSQGVVSDFDNIRKAAPPGPRENARAVAQAVIDEYERAECTQLLIEELYRRGWGDSGFTQAMSRFLPLGDQGGGQQQAAFALRANFLQSPRLSKFLTECEPRLCVIAAKANFRDGKVAYSSGTGLLVAPDLVLTARHVLKFHIRNGEQLSPSPGPLYAFFDHLFGEPIIEIDTPLKPELLARVRAVAFAADWLVDTCDDIPGEAFDQPTEDQITELRAKLDYALVQLAEPIGTHSRYAYGGTRRGWFDLSQYLPPTLRKHDRIIIPQHPSGQAQRIDFGRFSKLDPSGTRLRYDAETTGGTSGAPCFNQNFELVGIHNAAFAPNNVPIFNQAVHFGEVMKRLRPKYPNVSANGTSALWSVSTNPSSPRVIIGRELLMDWINKAAEELPPSRKQRVYAAATTARRSGKTFSLDILKAALRGTSDRVVELGTDVERMPTSAADFVTALLSQLAVPPADIGTMPPRPSYDRTEGASEDKLNVWLSRTLPSWLNGILLKNREWQVDVRLEAKLRIDNPPTPGMLPDPMDEQIANSPNPILETRSRWRRIWIVIDNATENEIKPLQDLITGLVGSRLDQNAVPDELRRMRWLFLGQKPDFLGEVHWEALDPMSISASSEAVKVCIRNLAASYNTTAQDQMLGFAALTVEEMADDTPFKADYDNPLKRLETLQAVIGSLRPKFAKLLGASSS